MRDWSKLRFVKSTAVEIIPDSLFSFLKWIFEDSTEETSGITLDKNLSDSQRTNRKITSIAQDLIFAFLNGRQPIPKHIGLAVAIKHLTGSKALIEILSYLQRCIGYHDVFFLFGKFMACNNTYLHAKFKNNLSGEVCKIDKPPSLSVKP